MVVRKGSMEGVMALMNFEIALFPVTILAKKVCFFGFESEI